MAARLTLSVLVLVILCISLSQALRIGPKQCCFKFIGPVSEKKVTGYTFTHQGCPKAAVLLKMKNGHVCANPSEYWVKALIDHLDSRNQAGKVSTE
ncbi:C-C motif chemokine 21a-like [Eucyclogobius newberryi]|uniref:C-C motif chemokine 21a-like n=1 Tax=Eucyclogobius newberryi TaxID=166745 RepID=UPI003B5A18B5